jgi:hypothetical protein
VLVLGIANVGQPGATKVLVDPVREPAGDFVGPVAPVVRGREFSVVLLVAFARLQIDTLGVEPELFAQRESAISVACPARRKICMYGRGKYG